MRHAFTTLVVGLCLILAPCLRGGTPSQAAGTGPIPQARKLIEAGNHSAALTVLEDALLEAPAQDRPVILDLLRKSYEVLARKAEAAGQASQAAHYRDNLAILDRSRPPTPPIRPKAATAGQTASDPSRTVRPAPAPAPAQDPVPRRVLPTLPEPAPLPAPDSPRGPAESPDGRGFGRPEPEIRTSPLPGGAATVTGNPSPAGARRIPDTGPPMLTTPESDREGTLGSRSGPPPLQPPDQADAPAEDINPGSATPEAETRSPAAAAPGPESDRETARNPGPAALPGRRSSPELDRADRLFTAKQFAEAGRLYGSLAGQNRLPADRRPHWAYCRAAEVVRKINARPRSAREWDAIEADVQEIQRLMPGNWVGEYLRNLVAEGRGTVRRPSARSKNLIVRGSDPEEPQPQPPTRRLPRLFGRDRGDTNAQPNRDASPPPAPAHAPAPDRLLKLPGAASGSGPLLALNDATTPGAETTAPIDWQVHDTANFRIFHCDLTLARQAAEIAESVRTAQAKRWNCPAATATWSPRCDVYLHPNPRSYAEATGQPEVSPGVSTMANDGTRVVSRRMNFRANNPLLLTATLPHEVTHIVMADVFIVRQIPRWADEGIAVLAEPIAEQRHRVADLQRPLESGRVFPVAQLMKMDYPDEKDWRLFYAQSVSLTRYLVDQGPPERFIQFVQDSQRLGPEAALRDVYQIEGLDELHSRWQAHARKQVAVETASSRDANSQAPMTTR